MTLQTRKSNCSYCGYLCGLNVTVETADDVTQDIVDSESNQGQLERILHIEPDPTRYPYDASIMQGCRRWQMLLTELDSPQRINYPLRRVGARGQGQFERISWSVALSEISPRLQELITQHGPETICSSIGGPHTSYWPLHRFMNIIDSPNNMGIGQICWNIRIWTEIVLYGWPQEPDVQPGLTNVIVLWGTNPAQSDNSLFWRRIIEMHKTGTQLIAIDPRLTQSARLADLHIQLNPASDAALAQMLLDGQSNMEGLNECGLKDSEIVKLLNYLDPAQNIAIVCGRGLDQLGAASSIAHRNIALLRHQLGQLNRPGASLMLAGSDFVNEYECEMSALLSDGQKAKQLNSQIGEYQTYAAFDKYSQVALDQSGGKNQLPMRYLTSAHPELVWNAILTGQPYQISALIGLATNPLVTYANTNRVKQAMQKLELIVIADQYQSATTAYADYVLPSAGPLERATWQSQGGIANFAYGGGAAIAPLYERVDDYEICRRLGVAIGQAEYWPEATFEQAIAHILEPTGMTYSDWVEQGIYMDESSSTSLRGGEADAAIHLKSAKGQNGLPRVAPNEIWCYPRNDERAGSSRLQSAQRFPYTLLTGARTQPFWGSSFHDREEFLKAHPHPIATISVEIAQDCDIKDGDTVEVFTSTGSCLHIAKVDSTMLPQVISIEYGWGGEHNANQLTNADPSLCDPFIGTWPYNGLACNIVKHT